MKEIFILLLENFYWEEMMKKNIKRAIFIGSKKLGIEVLKSIYSVSDKLHWIIVMPDDSNDSILSLSS